MHRTRSSNPGIISLLPALVWLASCGQGVFGEPPSCEDACAENATCAVPGDIASCACEPGYDGDGYTCSDIDECAAGNPCGAGTCTNVDGWYLCDCPGDERFDGTTCTSDAIFIQGAGTPLEPRSWEDGSLSPSCLDYIAPEQPYVYDGSTGDGWYTVSVDGQVVVVYCDMSTDGGGFTRVLHWDRESDAAAHTLATLQASLVDEVAEAGNIEVSAMGDLSEQPDHVRWSDFDTSYDALAWRLDIDVPNSGDVLFDVHYEGASMESSGTWFYAATADGPQDLSCWSTAEGNGSYTPSEHALVPYTCDSDPAADTFTWDSLGLPEQYALPGAITSFHIRSLHADVTLGDSSHLYRVAFYVR